MSTRHTSAQGDYPFIPGLSGNDRKLAKKLLDIYVIVQGDPTGLGTAVDYPKTELISATEAANVATFTFRSTYTTGHYWDYTFTVPDITVRGQIDTAPAVGGDVWGVLSYKTLMTSITFPVNSVLEIEPARVQWQVEDTADLLFQNITRCNSIEDEDTLHDVLTASDMVDDTIRFENGHNSTVSFEDDTLTFTAGTGIGKGRMPDLGNTDPMLCPEPDLDASPEGVYVINGLLPDNGDIALSVSSSLYIEREPGKIRIRQRQA